MLRAPLRLLLRPNCQMTPGRPGRAAANNANNRINVAAALVSQPHRSSRPTSTHTARPAAANNANNKINVAAAFSRTPNRPPGQRPRLHSITTQLRPAPPRPQNPKILTQTLLRSTAKTTRKASGRIRLQHEPTQTLLHLIAAHKDNIRSGYHAPLIVQAAVLQRHDRQPPAKRPSPKILHLQTMSHYFHAHSPCHLEAAL